VAAGSSLVCLGGASRSIAPQSYELWRSRPLLKLTEAPLAESHEEPDTDDDGKATAETRWPMAGAVLAAICLTILLPRELQFGPRWLLPVIEIALLIALIIGDPGRITRRSQTFRVLAIGLASTFALGSLATTGYLVHELVVGGDITSQGVALLVAGTKVWIGNTLAFCLLYWELDGGGPAARFQPHAAASRSGISAAAERGQRSPQVEAQVCRLPLLKRYKLARVWPRGRDASRLLGQADNGASIHDIGSGLAARIRESSVCSLRGRDWIASGGFLN
jgi:hypothetical protein